MSRTFRILRRIHRFENIPDNDIKRVELRAAKITNNSCVKWYQMTTFSVPTAREKLLADNGAKMK